MKKLMLGAAVAAAFAAPAIAHADTNATVGIQYSNIDFDSLGDADMYGLTGAFNHDFGGWEIQMDAATSRFDVSGCCYSQGYAAVHADTRTDTYAYGGFVTFQDLIYYSGLGAGIEGQWHMSNFTFDGSLSYTDFSDLDFSITHAQVGGTYFITPDFSLGANVGYVDADSADGASWGVGGEYRFAGSPASVNLGYHQLDIDSFDVDAWTIGLTLDLGTDSLQDRTHSGPSLNGASSLNTTMQMLIP